MLKSTFLQLRGLMLLTGLLIFGNSCKDKAVEVIAGFTYAADATNFTKVTFTNASQNATTYAWDFGDGTTSTEANPVHTFAKEGSYIVKLTAKGESDQNESTQTIVISDPNATLTALAGVDSKTWKLLRVPGGGRYPLEVGPIAKNTIWWAMGLGNDEIANRPCIMNDEFTFYRNGDYKVDTKGDFWLEGNVYAKPDNKCGDTKTDMKGLNGEDLSAWGGGSFKYAYAGGAKPTLTVTGLGAFVGFFKSGTDIEVKVPQSAVTYQVLKLTDGPVDTLVIEADYKFTAADAAPGGYWKYVLVHYDNAADEPAIPSAKPKASFSSTNTGSAYTFTNTSSNATSYAWDFGDGTKATSKDATHTYTSEGFFTISLTATNASGSATATQSVFISNTPLTAALLQGKSWKVRADANSVVVGPGMFDPSWYQVPKANLTGGGTGADDWSCMTDDEFIFGAAGVYTYKGNGSVRNDGYLGATNGCMDEATVTGNGTAFLSNVHSYVLTPAAGTTPALITLTNGAKGAAFIGFYKGYYGGENTDKALAPNGGNTTNIYQAKYAKNSAGVEFLFVSVDLSKDHKGTSSWSVVLTR